MTLLRNTCALPWNTGIELNFREKGKKKRKKVSRALLLKPQQKSS